MRKCYYRRLTQRQHSAAQVNGKVALGDYAGAIESSNREVVPMTLMSTIDRLRLASTSGRTPVNTAAWTILSM